MQLNFHHLHCEAKQKLLFTIQIVCRIAEYLFSLNQQLDEGILLSQQFTTTTIATLL